MLFNSATFLIFFASVFAIYWFVFNHKKHYQNILLLIASYVFYGWWDWRFLSLILLSTVVDFYVGTWISNSQVVKRRKFLLGISLGINLGLLGFFKYYNFFIDNWIEAWSSLGVTMHASSLRIILPVGISFYTFQTLSYTIDVYRKKIEPTKHFINFATFVAFFPQLVAGPIERAANLLPQFSAKRMFNYSQATSGLKLMIWGFFKKVVIADNCAFFVNQIFENSHAYGSTELALGTVLFAFQIYGDFSGYSDIAIGTARLFGFDLMTNFKFPYLSKNIADFWRRWHISLSTWFRDYLYIPLGGSRVSIKKQVRNVFIIFLVSGFWHGANWTFIVWGGFHAILFIPLLLQSKNRRHLHENKIRTIEILKIFSTFVLVCLAWIYFRADSILSANDYMINMFKGNDFSMGVFIKSPKYLLLTLICFSSIILLLFEEVRAYLKGDNEVLLSKTGSAFYILLIMFMGVFKNPIEFIYFQF